jgi:hypothetical protein
MKKELITKPLEEVETERHRKKKKQAKKQQHKTNK